MNPANYDFGDFTQGNPIKNRDILYRLIIRYEIKDLIKLIFLTFYSAYHKRILVNTWHKCIQINNSDLYTRGNFFPIKLFSISDHILNLSLVNKYHLNYVKIDSYKLILIISVAVSLKATRLVATLVIIL